MVCCVLLPARPLAGDANYVRYALLVLVVRACVRVVLGCFAAKFKNSHFQSALKLQQKLQELQQQQAVIAAQREGKVLPEALQRKKSEPHCSICHMVKRRGNGVKHGKDHCEECKLEPNKCQYTAGHKKELMIAKQISTTEVKMNEKKEKEDAAAKMRAFKVCISHFAESHRTTHTGPQHARVGRSALTELSVRCSGSNQNRWSDSISKCTSRVCTSHNECPGRRHSLSLILVTCVRMSCGCVPV